MSGVAAYGMARMAQELAGELPVKVGVFTDMDEAREWLGLQGWDSHKPRD